MIEQALQPRAFTTIFCPDENGVEGNGGAIDSSGAVVAGGWVFVNSGYGQFGQMPGNVLLAFGVGERDERSLSDPPRTRAAE